MNQPTLEPSSYFKAGVAVGIVAAMVFEQVFKLLLDGIVHLAKYWKQRIRIKAGNEIIGLLQIDESQNEQRGTVVRAYDDGIGYLKSGSGYLYGFHFKNIQGYSGESVREMGLRKGAPVIFKPSSNPELTVKYLKVGVFELSRITK